MDSPQKPKTLGLLPTASLYQVMVRDGMYPLTEQALESGMCMVAVYDVMNQQYVLYVPHSPAYPYVKYFCVKHMMNTISYKTNPSTLPAHLDWMMANIVFKFRNIFKSPLVVKTRPRDAAEWLDPPTDISVDEYWAWLQNVETKMGVGTHTTTNENQLDPPERQRLHDIMKQRAANAIAQNEDIDIIQFYNQSLRTVYNENKMRRNEKLRDDFLDMVHTKKGVELIDAILEIMVKEPWASIENMMSLKDRDMEQAVTQYLDTAKQVHEIIDGFEISELTHEQFIRTIFDTEEFMNGLLEPFIMSSTLMSSTFVRRVMDELTTKRSQSIPHIMYRYYRQTYVGISNLRPIIYTDTFLESSPVRRHCSLRAILAAYNKVEMDGEKAVEKHVEMARSFLNARLPITTWTVGDLQDLMTYHERQRQMFASMLNQFNTRVLSTDQERIMGLHETWGEWARYVNGIGVDRVDLVRFGLTIQEIMARITDVLGQYEEPSKNMIVSELILKSISKALSNSEDPWKVITKQRLETLNELGLCAAELHRISTSPIIDTDEVLPPDWQGWPAEYVSPTEAVDSSRFWLNEAEVKIWDEKVRKMDFADNQHPMSGKKDSFVFITWGLAKHVAPFLYNTSVHAQWKKVEKAVESLEEQVRNTQKYYDDIMEILRKYPSGVEMTYNAQFNLAKKLCKVKDNERDVSKWWFGLCTCLADEGVELYNRLCNTLGRYEETFRKFVELMAHWTVGIVPGDHVEQQSKLVNLLVGEIGQSPCVNMGLLQIGGLLTKSIANHIDTWRKSDPVASTFDIPTVGLLVTYENEPTKRIDSTDYAKYSPPTLRAYIEQIRHVYHDSMVVNEVAQWLQDKPGCAWRVSDSKELEASKKFGQHDVIRRYVTLAIMHIFSLPALLLTDYSVLTTEENMRFVLHDFVTALQPYICLSRHYGETNDRDAVGALYMMGSPSQMVGVDPPDILPASDRSGKDIQLETWRRVASVTKRHVEMDSTPIKLYLETVREFVCDRFVTEFYPKEVNRLLNATKLNEHETVCLFLDSSNNLMTALQPRWFTLIDLVNHIPDLSANERIAQIAFIRDVDAEPMYQPIVTTPTETVPPYDTITVSENWSGHGVDIGEDNTLLGEESMDVDVYLDTDVVTETTTSEPLGTAVGSRVGQDVNLRLSDEIIESERFIDYYTQHLIEADLIADPRHQPIFWGLRSMEARRATFRGHEAKFALSVDTLSWYGQAKYGTSGDTTICMSCGLVLHQWEPNDQPFFEHVRHMKRTVDRRCLLVNLLEAKYPVLVHKPISNVALTMIECYPPVELLHPATAPLTCRKVPSVTQDDVQAMLNQPCLHTYVESNPLQQFIGEHTILNIIECGMPGILTTNEFQDEMMRVTTAAGIGDLSDLEEKSKLRKIIYKNY
ncbi:PREDICTED: uncharacterized protein LOC109473281 [Branchiostoma belcheri]|uniref:Uncharacterized protein LOC109473281 n=1 Tax=Branchiostoma belcheri TaxID=7741 RepID=A0A6P4ZGD3_BRABE|nr:PREDICTED: uncharacterized protein LOC109473281 [Branchiostoma belcheri]